MSHGPSLSTDAPHPELASAIDTLRTLVGFDTVSSRSNRALIDWVANRYQDLGIHCHIQEGDEPGKANLFATVGPSNEQPGVMLSGHSDVVPVEGQNWNSDPFTLTERDGNLHGRGSADMKAFIACFTALAPSFARAALKRPLHLALSYNEETNMGGMRRLATQLQSMPVKPQACIIGEPTSMRMVVANKGVAIYRCKVRGHSVHSSLRDQGVSAVEMAARAIVFINELQRDIDAALRHDGFEYPHTSLHVGMIRGGTAPNITADDCEFSFEIRTLPGMTAADVLARVRRHCDERIVAPLHARFPSCSIGFEEILDTPGLDERGNLHLAQALKPLCGHGDFGRVSFGTEGGILQQAGIQTVICGPGQIKVAHRPDEYVEIDQLDRCLKFLDRLTARLEAEPVVP